MEYQITVREAPEPKVREYMHELGISRILASALINQNISIEMAMDILTADCNEIHHSVDIPNIENAAAKIKEYLMLPKAVIQVFADYDADGITSCAIACKALYRLREVVNPKGKTEVIYRVPERKDGYGLSMQFAEQFAEVARINPNMHYLIITVDNGITAGPAVAKLIQEPNIDVVVTDHHQPDFEHGLTPTDICCCVDPYLEENSDWKYLAGCGVIFNVMQKVEELCGLDHAITESLYYLAAIGTIGDMMQINLYHACLIQIGLMQLNAEPTVKWISWLKKEANIPHITAKDIAFTIAPLINSCGQMGHASFAIELLLADNNEEMLMLIDKIYTLYLENKDETKSLKQYAEDDVVENYLPEHRFILYPLRTNHAGLASKVATHLGKQLGIPIILWAETEENKNEETIAGSCRNDTPAPIMNIVRKAVTEGLLESAEGHTYAFGVKLYRSKLKELQDFLDQAIIKYEKSYGEIKPTVRNLNVDCIVSSGDINVRNMLDIEQIPFSKNLEAPIVMIRGADIKNVRTSSNNPKNLRYTIQSRGAMRPIDIWAWNIKPDQYKRGEHKHIDMIGTIERNFMMPEYATLNVIDIRTY